MPPAHDERFTLTAAGKDGELVVPAVFAAVTSPEGKVVEARLELRPLVIGSSAECEIAVADQRL